ncbi:MAG: type IV secretion system DNA-binding domain-containing protein, partial [Candidatus Sungbacteria bacterium]|nr:type IV secretion system DNA-binding domain-containing protein [Candidatus Sungbacteria bacterium]
DARRRFGIKPADRRKHMYIIGKTGMGKTTLLENMAIQDIQNGKGLGIIDPHGEFAERMLDFVPSERIEDVIYFNPSDLEYPVAFNSMESVLPEQRHLIASGLLGVFKKIWPDVWSARMEYLLSNSILALLEVPGSTLLGINRMFADKEFRKSIVFQLTDPVVRAFWEKEYAQYQERFATEASAAIQNKIGQFTSNPLIRNIVGQERSSVDMREVMDGGKIFIMNISKGKVGEENSRLLGAMLVTKLYLTAMTRVDVPEEERRDFYLYVDEFQNFATESFANILAEARKYRLSLILAHQYVAQMDEKVADAVFGNVGTTVTFRVGAPDAELLEKEFNPEFMAEDLVNLGFAQIYLKLMIDGIASRPFSATTLAPLPKPAKSNREAIIKLSRKQYGTSAEEVRQKIEKFHGLSFGAAASVRTGNDISPAPMFGPADGGAARKADRKLYEARCAIDGELVMVPFMPDKRRPVYCEKHLEMLRRGEAIPAPPESPRNPVPPSAPSVSRFSSPRPALQKSVPSRPAVRFPPAVSRPLSLDVLKPKETAKDESGDFNGHDESEISSDHSSRPGRREFTRPQPQKKEVDLQGLREILSQSVVREEEKAKHQEEDKNGKIIQPGERITFE